MKFPDILDKKICKECRFFRIKKIRKDKFPMCLRFGMKVDPYQDACDNYE